MWNIFKVNNKDTGKTPLTQLPTELLITVLNIPQPNIWNRLLFNFYYQTRHLPYNQCINRSFGHWTSSTTVDLSWRLSQLLIKENNSFSFFSLKKCPKKSRRSRNWRKTSKKIILLTKQSKARRNEHGCWNTCQLFDAYTAVKASFLFEKELSWSFTQMSVTGFFWKWY